MNDIFEPLDEDEMNWLDGFLLNRIDKGSGFEDKDVGVEPHLEGVILTCKDRGNIGCKSTCSNIKGA